MKREALLKQIGGYNRMMRITRAENAALERTFNFTDAQRAVHEANDRAVIEQRLEVVKLARRLGIPLEDALRIGVEEIVR